MSPVTAVQFVQPEERASAPSYIKPVHGQMMSGADAVIHVLMEQGVDTIFGYPGGAIMPIYDSYMRVDHPMEHILTANEAGAGHAAQGYARVSGKTGVLFVTSGPGLTNAVTPMADALGDSIPMVVVSGQVATSLIGTDAFQEVDATGITQPVTKFNRLVRRAEDLIPALREAFALASTGRPGPVHIDVPKDIQNAQVQYTMPRAEETARAKFKAEVMGPRELQAPIERAVQMMTAAQRPMFYVGGGVINSGPAASHAMTQLLDATGFPATSTLMGLGAYPTSHPAHTGMLGMHGTYQANRAMHESDLIIAVGARFDDRVTGKVDAFAPKARIVHIDIDRAEFSKIIRADIKLHGDAGAVLRQMMQAWRMQAQQYDRGQIDAWRAQIAEWSDVRCLDVAPSDTDIRPQHAMSRLAAALAGYDDYVVATNVGKHQMWAAQYLPFSKPGQFVTSGKVGTMGYGLPAAIGAQWAKPDVPVVVVTGDASWRMNTPEVETACRKGLPVKVIMLNDNALGMVDQWQGLFHGKRYSQSSFDNSSKDFVAEFKAQGGNANGERITSPYALDDAIHRMMQASGPYFLEVKIRKEDCYPMVAAGQPHNQMQLYPEAAARLPRPGM